MLSLLKKILNNNFFKIILTLLILIYFYYNLDINLIKDSIKSIDLITLFTLLIILLVNPLLFVIRWFHVVKYFHKEKFIDFYTQISKGLVISELLQNSSFLDLYKFYKLKNINLKNRFLLIFNEKIIILFTRIVFILILFTLINYYIFRLFIIENFILILITIIFCYYIIINIKKFKDKLFINLLYNYYIKFFSKKIINRKKIFFVEILRNLILSTSYFIISINFFDTKTALIIVIIGPIIELFLKIQFISVIGLRELVFYFLGLVTYIDENLLITSSIIMSFAFMFTNLINFIISRLLIFSKN